MRGQPVVFINSLLKRLVGLCFVPSSESRYSHEQTGREKMKIERKQGALHPNSCSSHILYMSALFRVMKRRQSSERADRETLKTWREKDALRPNSCPSHIFFVRLTVAVGDGAVVLFFVVATTQVSVHG